MKNNINKCIVLENIYDKLIEIEVKLQKGNYSLKSSLTQS